MIDKHEEQNHQTPEWLKTIQLNSWEAELLVSALVLYALFQVPDYLEVLALQNIAQESNIRGFVALLVMAIKLLRIGYILHILVRGLWVASVGLSYVFPEGINKDSLKFKGKFNKELESNKSLVNSVLRLEELSSMIYGISFLLFGSFVGFATMSFGFLFFIEALNPIVQENSWAGPGYALIAVLYLVCVLVLLIDFITGGLLRRKKWSAEWFYPIAYVFRFLTLSFLYRRSLLVLMSNVKGWKSRMVPLALMLLILGFYFAERKIRRNQIDNYLVNNQEVSALNANYENRRDNSDDPLLTTIQSDIITENTLRIFLKDLGMFRTFYNTAPVSKVKWSEVSPPEISTRLNNWLTVKIDSMEIDSLSWYRAQHKETYSFGLITYIDIESLKRGPHNISFSIDTTNLNQWSRGVFKNGRYNYENLSNIYFFYDKQ